MLNFVPYKKDFLPVQSLESIENFSLMKKKLKAIQNDFIKVQNKSKLVTINPIFNKKEYLGKNTEPLPIERFLIEMNFP